ncbi:hypothetical protein [Faecalispora anaeroviscerum]|uniref:hypothetical protein n=1 Tax=Faecalispora anaeroviscerum TaxID=2991836 RepID=UPI0024BA3572|nr:hypothetical protein [Faecalispora anaeroviscerum]
MDDNHRAQSNGIDQVEQEETAEPPQPGHSQKLNLVADEDAAEYEEQQTGVRFSYILRQEECYEALKQQDSRSQAYKKKVRWLMLVGAVVVICLILGIAIPEQGGRLLRVAILGALADFFVWISPRLRMNGMAKQLTTGEEISVAVYPDEISITVGTNHWNIPLDDTAKMDLTPQLILLYSEGRGLVIPQRSIDPAIRADVLAILTAGTQKYE